MKGTLLIILFCSISVHLRAQNYLPFKDTNEIIDPIVNDSIFFKRKKNNLILPKTISGTKNGYAIVEVLLTKENKIKDYSIARLIFYINKKKILDYYIDSEIALPIGLQNEKISSIIKTNVENYIHKDVILKRLDFKNYSIKYKFLIRFK